MRADSPGLSSEAPQDGAAGDVGGFRLVRRLAVGSRSTVFLAHGETGHGAAQSGNPVSGDSISTSGSVVLKIFAPGTAAASINTELGALAAIENRHIVRLIDVATGSDTLPCLIMERVNGPSLARILSSSAGMARGEATTIVAPLLSAVQALHDAGFTHGRISAGKVLIDPAGRPVLLGFGGALARRELPPDGSAWRAAILADQRALLSLSLDVFDSIEARDEDVVVLGRPPDGSAPHHRGPEPLAGAREAVIETLGMGPVDSFLPRLEAWVFDQAEPVAVRSFESGLGPNAAVPSPEYLEPVGPLGDEVQHEGRWGSETASETTADWPEVDEQRPIQEQTIVHGPLSSLLHMVPVPDWVRQLVPPSVRGRRPMRFRRKPVVIGGILAAVLVLVSLLLVPAGSQSESRGPAISGRESAAENEAAVGPTGHVAEVPAESTDAAASILADDPALALVALSARRDRCLMAKSVDCLSGVHQWQSAAAAADVAMLGGVPAGEPVQFASFDTRSLATIERTGDSAIVTGAIGSPVVPGEVAGNDKPASFLLMKGEAGWRLRDVFFG